MYLCVASLLKICFWLFISYRKILKLFVWLIFFFRHKILTPTPLQITGLFPGLLVYAKSNHSVQNAFHSFFCELENSFELTLGHKHHHLYEDCLEFTEQSVLLSDLVPFLHYISYYFWQFL